jgi:hyperosmotically inducible periplasmic protein
MFKRITPVVFILTGSLLLMTGTANGVNEASIYTAAGSPLENTQRNVRDKDGTTLTPDEQKNDKKDINITTQIRKALIKEKSLSINAQNIKIITGNRIVTLRGIVDNAEESTAIEKIAKKMRDVIRIDNQLEVKAP